MGILMMIRELFDTASLINLHVSPDTTQTSEGGARPRRGIAAPPSASSPSEDSDIEPRKSDSPAARGRRSTLRPKDIDQSTLEALSNLKPGDDPPSDPDRTRRKKGGLAKSRTSIGPIAPPITPEPAADSPKRSRREAVKGSTSWLDSLGVANAGDMTSDVERRRRMRQRRGVEKKTEDDGQPMADSSSDDDWDQLLAKPDRKKKQGAGLADFARRARRTGLNLPELGDNLSFTSDPSLIRNMIASMAAKLRARPEGVPTDEDEFQAHIAEQIALTNSERAAEGLAMLSQTEVEYFTAFYRALDQNKGEGSVLESFDKLGFGLGDEIDDESGNSESEGGRPKKAAAPAPAKKERQRRGRDGIDYLLDSETGRRIEIVDGRPVEGVEGVNYFINEESGKVISIKDGKPVEGVEGVDYIVSGPNNKVIAIRNGKPVEGKEGVDYLMSANGKRIIGISNGKPNSGEEGIDFMIDSKNGRVIAIRNGKPTEGKEGVDFIIDVKRGRVIAIRDGKPTEGEEGIDFMIESKNGRVIAIRDGKPTEGEEGIDFMIESKNGRVIAIRDGKPTEGEEGTDYAIDFIRHLVIPISNGVPSLGLESLDWERDTLSSRLRFLPRAGSHWFRNPFLRVLCPSAP
jgi:hypothetical protein